MYTYINENVTLDSNGKCGSSSTHTTFKKQGFKYSEKYTKTCSITYTRS